MPEMTDKEIKDLVLLLEDALLNEKYADAINELTHLVKSKLEPEDEKAQKRILDNFVKKARGVRPAIVMMPALKIGEGINKTREGDRKEMLACMLNCGGAIWNGIMSGNPDKLRKVLFEELPSAQAAADRQRASRIKI